MTREYEYAVYLGRFQPPHKSHINAMKQALEVADNLIVLIGSADASPSLKNPFSVQDRENMIFNALGDLKNRVITIPIRDYYYNDQAWLSEITVKVNDATKYSERITIMVHHKDATQAYLNDFKWDATHIVQGTYPTNATDIRNTYFSSKGAINVNWVDKYLDWTASLHKTTTDYMLDFSKSDTFKHLAEEYEYICKYKEAWAGTPHPVTFNTVDALVVKSNHVLVVKRKFVPGKGLLALPGGFLRPNETLRQAAVRELKEETRIALPKKALDDHIIGSKVFDYPDRDPRGRVVTQCFFIDLGQGDLPNVKGDDDAEHAKWIPLQDVLCNPRMFYGDHGQIITQFLLENKWTYGRDSNRELLASMRNMI